MKLFIFGAVDMFIFMYCSLFGIYACSLSFTTNEGVLTAFSLTFLGIFHLYISFAWAKLIISNPSLLGRAS